MSPCFPPYSLLMDIYFCIPENTFYAIPHYFYSVFMLDQKRNQGVVEKKWKTFFLWGHREVVVRHCQAY